MEKFCGVVVAPLNPTGEAGKLVPALFQYGLPVHGIECIRKVEFAEHSVGIVAVTVTPLFGRPEAYLSAKRDRDSYLQGEKQGTG